MNKLVLTVVVLFSVVFSTRSQSLDSVKYEIINHPYYNGSPLEKSIANLAVRVRGLGYGGADSNYEINGTKSKIRVKKGSDLYFVINSMAGANMMMSLYRMEIRKGKRVTTHTRYRTFSGMDVGGDAIGLNVIQIKDNLFKLIPDGELEEGEYSIMYHSAASGMSREAFSFGVDYDPSNYIDDNDIDGSYKLEMKRIKEMFTRWYLDKGDYYAWTGLLKEERDRRKKANK